MNELLDALLTTNNLKVTPRTGWVMRGVPDAESVAEHTYGVALIALLLAAQVEKETPLDRGKLLAMALLHDLAESMIGDIPQPAQRFLPPGAKHAAEQQALKELLGAVAGGETLLAAWADYENQAGPEARLVRDADRLDVLLQAYIYAERSGNRALAEFWQGLPAREALAFEASRTLYAAMRSRFEQIADWLAVKQNQEGDNYEKDR